MIISIILGLIPEFIYYYIYLTKIKELKGNNILFFILTFINCFMSIIYIKHDFYMYILFDIIEYILLKLSYKKQICIIDFFLLIFSEIYLLIISALCYYLISNYIIAFITNRILMFLPLIFISKIRIIYKKYKNMWNRNDKKNNPIKSLTLRNTSVVIMDILIVAVYLILMYSFN